MKHKEIRQDPATLTDAELLALSTAEPRYFEEIVSRYQRPFVRKAVSILGSEEEAQDAVQDVFVRIYVAAKKFRTREGASFSSWAYTILTNQCYTLYRKGRRAAAVSFETNPELVEVIPDQAALSEIETRMSTDYVLAMLAKLPDLLGRAVKRHFIDGLPQKAIAAEEGVSHGVIRSRIHRAKKELRKLDLELAFAGAKRPGSKSS